MRKILFILAVLCTSIAMTSCADSKTFTKADGTTFTAHPYGWMCQEMKKEGVEYEVNTGDVVLSIVFSETIVAPILLTGLDIFEPVAYYETNNNNN